MRMTKEKAISVLANHQDYILHDEVLGICTRAPLQNAIVIAIKALREQEERENPKPLTIEELHKMIGEPVWVQGPGLPQYGRWGIVEDAFGKSLFLVNDFTCHDIGKAWIAYRHKPKEVEK